MTDLHAVLAVAVMSAVTILLRFAPFWLFSGRETPKIITYLGKVLPFAVMGMLVVYCLKNISFTAVRSFVPELIAGALAVGTYVWKRSTLLSILLSTAVYMLLVQLVFV